jgi:hypothetical protein
MRVLMLCEIRLNARNHRADVAQNQGSRGSIQGGGQIVGHQINITGSPDMRKGADGGSWGESLSLLFVHETAPGLRLPRQPCVH